MKPPITRSNPEVGLNPRSEKEHLRTHYTQDLNQRNSLEPRINGGNKRLEKIAGERGRNLRERLERSQNSQQERERLDTMNEKIDESRDS